jgi:hypothetical protein
VFDVFREWFEEQVRSGMSPRRVGEIVLDAIREDRFYILPHPECGAGDRESRPADRRRARTRFRCHRRDSNVFLQRLAAVQERQS